jgi:hypothetical protein
MSARSRKRNTCDGPNEAKAREREEGRAERKDQGQKPRARAEEHHHSRRLPHGNITALH